MLELGKLIAPAADRKTRGYLVRQAIAQAVGSLDGTYEIGGFRALVDAEDLRMTFEALFVFRAAYEGRDSVMRREDAIEILGLSNVTWEGFRRPGAYEEQIMTVLAEILVHRHAQ